MGAFLFSLIGGAVAGALASRYVVKREFEALRQPLKEPAVTAPPPPEIAPEITPEILMVISAAVAAFCGKRARIRRARVAGPTTQGSAWAQQGRVFVQASHNLAR